MSRQWIMRGLLAVILLQVGVLVAEYVNSAYPLWTGQEIRLKIVPVDPRSIFRGNYARLSYEISNISIPAEIGTQDPRLLEVIYVELKQGENELHVVDSASFSEPETGLYIRGRIQSWPLSKQPYHVIYGIEAFFVPKEKALALEKDLSSGGVAVVMVANNGKAALKDVIPKPKQDLSEKTDGLSEIENQKNLEPTPEQKRRRIGQELSFLKYAQDALSRDDPESAYRLIEDGLISEYEEVREKSRQFIEQNPSLYEGAGHSFRFESFKESLRKYGDDARKLENQRISIYKTIASVEDYLEARQSFIKVFGEID